MRKSDSVFAKKWLYAHECLFYKGDSKVIEAGLILGAGLLDGRARVRILVEVLKVRAGSQLGYPWGLNLLGLDHGPVYSSKPDVTFDIFSGIDHAAEPLGKVGLQQARDQLSRIN